MNGQKVIQHHSEDDVKSYIDTGERLLREAGYDDAERVALLPTIINLLSSKTIMQDVQRPLAVDLGPFGGKLTG